MSQNLETEIIIYCRIGNFDGLQKATHIEYHEQMESEFKNGTRCRVRKISSNPFTVETIDPEAIKYEFTYKVKSDSDEGFEANQEYTNEIDSIFYEGFRNIAEKRLLKTRYTFESDKIVLDYKDENEQKHELEIPDIKYEVDVYTDKDGHVCEWCKIDVEVDSLIAYINEHHSDLENIKLNIRITHLPFLPTEYIMTLSADEQHQQFISSLWNEHYNLPVTDTTSVNNDVSTDENQ